MEAVAASASSRAARPWLPIGVGGRSPGVRLAGARTTSCAAGRRKLSRCRMRVETPAGAPSGLSRSAAAGSRIGPAALTRRKAWGSAPRLSSEAHSEAKVEETVQELEEHAEESKSSYSEAVDALKDKTVKLRDSARGAHESTAAKATEALIDTTDKLREEAEKAKAILSGTASDTAQMEKSNLNHLAESASDPIKDIADTAVNAHLKDTPKQGAKIHDFCLGIPYGAFLVAGGLLWFTLSGNTDALRYGVFLGGLLLFLSVRSLKVWKQGNSSMRQIQMQAAIALVIFLKDAQTFIKTRAFFPPALSAVASGAMLLFYAYVYFSGGNPPKKVKTADEAA